MWTMTEPKSTRTQCDAAVPSRPIGLVRSSRRLADDARRRSPRAGAPSRPSRSRSSRPSSSGRPGRAGRCRRPSCPRPARRSGGRARAAVAPRPARPWRGGAGRRRAGARRELGGRAGMAGSVTIWSSLLVVRYSAMVADVGGDRIRDEVAQRPAGRGPRRAAREADSRIRGPSRNVARSARSGKCGRPGTPVRRPGSRRAARRPAGPARAPGAARASVGSPANASADRMSTRSPARPDGREQRSSVSTVYDGPGRSSSIRLDREAAGCRRSRARPSPAGRRPG